MNCPQFKGNNIGVFNERQEPLFMLRRTNFRSIIGLYISQSLLYFGFVLVILNNLNVLSPGSYFGAYSWVTATVFSIGLIINFISIPHLYFSSFRNFNKDDDFWDKETFWILPLFFFGTFFLYGSQIQVAYTLVLISVAVITGIHISFIWTAWKFISKNGEFTYSSKQQYFTTLKYLTFYYLLLLTVLFLFNPLQQFFVWVRLHFA